jgi:phosphoketolase
VAGTTEVPTPLSPEELRKTDAYWRACNYLSAGMIYLRANPLLREPLSAEHIKNRLLGHWGSDPGQSLIWVHLHQSWGGTKAAAIFEGKVESVELIVSNRSGQRESHE